MFKKSATEPKPNLLSQPGKIDIHQLCPDTECCLENLPRGKQIARENQRKPYCLHTLMMMKRNKFHRNLEKIYEPGKCKCLYIKYKMESKKKTKTFFIIIGEKNKWSLLLFNRDFQIFLLIVCYDTKVLPFTQCIQVSNNLLCVFSVLDSFVFCINILLLH